MNKRIIKAGAIQPAIGNVPARFWPPSNEYKSNPPSVDDVIENHIKIQINNTIKLMDKAGEESCDIICGCEDVTITADLCLDLDRKGVYAEIVSKSQPVAEEAFSKVAKKHSMYVIGCYMVMDKGKVYNSASIFDRSGNICGQYRKTHLPANETWEVTPGDSIDVFDLDFGRIGISICYDMMFPDSVRVMALKGAEIIFHPTFGYGWYDEIGEATLKTRANDNGVYIITSKSFAYNGAGKSSVIDYWGQVLADAGFGKDVIVTKEIDLDIKKMQPDWYYNSYLTGISNVAERMRRERRPELYSEICVERKEKIIIPDDVRKQEILDAVISRECRW
jgi:predicted amidohydrolase